MAANLIIREISKYSITTDEAQSFAVWLSDRISDSPLIDEYILAIDTLILEFKNKEHPKSYLNDLTTEELDATALRAYGWATLIGLVLPESQEFTTEGTR